MAEMKSRTSVVGYAKARVKIYNDFIDALTMLKDSELVKSFDGKSINKRHTDKMQTLIPNHIKVELRSQEFTPYLNLNLYYSEYEKPDEDIRKHTDFYARREEVRQEKPNYYNKQTDTTYCLNGIREFNHTNFVICVEKKIEYLKENVKQYQDVIDRVDEVIEKTAELKKHIDKVLATFPPYLKPYVSFSETVYNDKK